MNRFEYDKLAYSPASWHRDKGLCVRTSIEEGDEDAIGSRLHLFGTPLDTEFKQQQRFLLVLRTWWEKDLSKSQNIHIKSVDFPFPASLEVPSATNNPRTCEQNGLNNAKKKKEENICRMLC